jgi:hypothetical protein
MTIETATPSSAETIAALFDNLVDAVAARVLAQLGDNVTVRIEQALESFAEQDLEGKIDEWAANFLQDRVTEHVTIDTSDLDLHDEVLDIVQNLSFDIRVSR